MSGGRSDIAIVGDVVKRLILILCVAALALVTVRGLRLYAAGAAQTFIGTITDDMCEKADHSRMHMGSTDAECTTACVDAHGASYVLYDGKSTYMLSDQRTPAKFAGKKVKVAGTLDAKSKTIQVRSITSN